MLPGNSATHLARASRPVPPEPIAVVGMACRFPGAPGLDDFWQLLRDGQDETTETPADLFDVEALAIPARAPLGRPDPGGAARPRMWRALTPRSPGSRRGRRSPPIRSSGCQWKSPRRRWRAPGKYQSIWSAIDWDEIPFRVQRELAPWPAAERALVGVSSFGISGTNVHVVLAGTCADFPAEADRAGQEFENTCCRASVCITHHEYRTAVVRSATGGEGATGCLRRDQCRLARGRRRREVKASGGPRSARTSKQPRASASTVAATSYPSGEHVEVRP
jgi:hypothetical protein